MPNDRSIRRSRQLVEQGDVFGLDGMVRNELATSLDTDKEILEALARDENKFVRENVADNPNAPASALEIPAKNDGDIIRMDAAENSGTPANVLAALTNDQNGTVSSRHGDGRITALS
ncbi:MAG: hypothetical protein LBI59_04480 [Candidatus Accumulibacter sp.]|jgi:hypothetical protein|nr:hypothetical protein [Accumulibacter sp.]